MLMLEGSQLAVDEAEAAGASPAEIMRLDADVVAAQTQLSVAQATLAELVAPRDTAELRLARDRARSDLDASERALATARAQAGPRIPRGEVAFVSTLPRRVDTVTAALGSDATQATVSLTGAQVTVEASVARVDVDLVGVGNEVRVREDVDGLEARGVVTEIEAPVPPATAFRVVITPLDGSLDEHAGGTLLVTFPVQATEGEVLAIPLGALVTDTAGQVWLRVKRESTFEDLEVALGLAADGMVEIASASGPLDVNDLVVVGAGP